MKRNFYILYVIFFLIPFGLSAQNLFLYYPNLTSGVGPAGIHHNEARINSIQSGIGRAISPIGGKRTAGAPALSEYTISKNFDGSSIKLMQAATNGAPSAANVEIRFYSADVLVLTIELADVLVSSFSSSSAGDGGSCPNCPGIDESLSLNFTKIKVTEVINDPTNPYQWNLINGTPTF